jgi:DNA polymerase III epsilon subunit-like protein
LNRDRTIDNPPVRQPIDRWSAIRWSRSLLAQERTIFLDTETTGLGRDSEIVEIAIVAVDGTVILDTLVKPHRPIPADATRIHGITDLMVARAPDWCDLLGVLRGLIATRPVVVYNAEFDRRMVRQCCERLGESLPLGDWHCAMRAYAAFREERTTGSRDYRWHKLSEATASLGVSVGGHRALGDAAACRQVVAAIAADGSDKRGESSPQENVPGGATRDDRSPRGPQRRVPDSSFRRGS